MADRLDSMMSPLDPGRALALTCVAALLASCTVLPPSLRSEAGAPGAKAPAPSTPPAAAAPQAAATAPPLAGSETRMFKGTGVFVNPRPSAPSGGPGPQEASLNFEALDVREVAKVILGDYLKESYTVHPAVAGTVTFRTIRPIAIKDLLPTLEMLLRQNGAAVVKEEGVYKILPIGQVRGSVSPQLGATTAPLPAGFSVLVVPLKFVSAREMVKLLEPFAADNTVRVDEVRNLVVMAGSQRELRHLIDTIELFDVDWLSGYSVGLFPIKSADVKSLVQDLDRVFGSGAQSPLAGVVRVIPIERLNALLVVTTQPRYLDIARTWVERLDQVGGTTGGVRFFVYQVRNGKAENLATLLSDLFSARRTTTTGPSLAPGMRPTEIRTTPIGTPPAATTTTTTSTPPASATFQIPGSGTSGQTASEVRVIADKDTNSLLILATPADYDVIESAIRKLDVIPRQVLVEVMLAEVTLLDEYSFGVGWFFRGKDNVTGSLAGGFLPTTPGGDVPANTDPGVLQIIQRAASGDVRAALRALGRDNKTKVLAAPQVMVLDNQKAQIKVGNRISVQTQSQTGVSTGSGVLNSFQYLETGILLAVTPRINSGGLVTLEVNQEVSVPGETSAGNPNPPVNSRSAQTTVVVGSGESVVLGGLISEDDGRGTQGLPLLSKIPILGAAFGTQSFRQNRTELVLIITPRIVNDMGQARQVTDELRQKLPSLEGVLPKRNDPPLPAAQPAPAPAAQNR